MLKLLKKVLLPLPFPVVIIWHIVLSSWTFGAITFAYTRDMFATNVMFAIGVMVYTVVSILIRNK